MVARAGRGRARRGAGRGILASSRWARQAAARAGAEAIVFTGRPDVAERLAAIAGAQGTRLLMVRPGEFCDLDRWYFESARTLRRKCADVLASFPAIC